MVGTGNRSERIRTYNFPQNGVTDHRIGLTLHRLDQVMEGDLEEIVTALRTHYQTKRLKGENSAPGRFENPERTSRRSREVTFCYGAQTTPVFPRNFSWLTFSTSIEPLGFFVRARKSCRPTIRAKFEKLVAKRSEGEPIAYLVGEKEFFSLPFYVDLSNL